MIDTSKLQTDSTIQVITENEEYIVIDHSKRVGEDGHRSTINEFFSRLFASLGISMDLGI